MLLDSFLSKIKYAQTHLSYWENDKESNTHKDCKNINNCASGESIREKGHPSLPGRASPAKHERKKWRKSRRER